MMKRFVVLFLVTASLLTLVFYSKFNPQPTRISGFIEADEIRLGSRVGGRVARVYIQEGQNVVADMSLVELEPFDLLEREKELQYTLAARAAELKRLKTGFREEDKLQAKAKLDQLQARLDLLKAGPRSQEIEAARGRLEQAEAERMLADRTIQRLTKLLAENAVSRQEIDNAKESLDAALASVVVRQQELNLLEAGTRKEELQEAAARVEEARQAWMLMQNGYREEEIEQAQAAYNAAQASVDALGQQRRELNITSPIDGIVEAFNLKPGDMVAPGAPVLSILDKSHLWVRAYIPQNQVSVQIGQMVRLTVDSHPEKSFSGTVSFVARQAEFMPSNVQTLEERSKQVYRIKVRVDDLEDLLRPGMTADVWLDQNGGTK